MGKKDQDRGKDDRHDAVDHAGFEHQRQDRAAKHGGNGQRAAGRRQEHEPQPWGQHHRVEGEVADENAVGIEAVEEKNDGDSDACRLRGAEGDARKRVGADEADGREDGEGDAHGAQRIGEEGQEAG